jgi:hypothetical protein
MDSSPSQEDTAMEAQPMDNAPEEAEDEDDDDEEEDEDDDDEEEDEDEEDDEDDDEVEEEEEEYDDNNDNVEWEEDNSDDEDLYMEEDDDASSSSGPFDNSLSTAILLFTEILQEPPLLDNNNNSDDGDRWVKKWEHDHVASRKRLAELLEEARLYVWGHVFAMYDRELRAIASLCSAAILVEIEWVDLRVAFPELKYLCREQIQVTNHWGDVVDVDANWCLARHALVDAAIETPLRIFIRPDSLEMQTLDRVDEFTESLTKEIVPLSAEDELSQNIYGVFHNMPDLSLSNDTVTDIAITRQAKHFWDTILQDSIVKGLKVCVTNAPTRDRELSTMYLLRTLLMDRETDLVYLKEGCSGYFHIEPPLRDEIYTFIYPLLFPAHKVSALNDNVTYYICDPGEEEHFGDTILKLEGPVIYNALGDMHPWEEEDGQPIYIATRYYPLPQLSELVAMKSYYGKKSNSEVMSDAELYRRHREYGSNLDALFDMFSSPQKKQDDKTDNDDATDSPVVVTVTTDTP